MKWIKDIGIITLAILAWWHSQYLLRMLDPVAASDDAGILQRMILAVVGLFFFHLVIKLFMKIFWPEADRYLAGDFNRDFNTLGLKIWHKLLLSALLYGLLLLTLALIY